MRVSTIRPGLLVHLSARVSGNAQYQRTEIESEHMTAEGTKRAKWETEKTIMDPVEHEAATNVSSKARGLIARTCAASGRFGLLCPVSNESALEKAIAEANAMVDEFNVRASLTRVDVFVMVGRIAEDDLQATKAINREVSDLLAQMETGVRKLDVEAIRDAAKAAKAIASMIQPAASERLEKAIDAARTAARAIVKAGEAAAVEIDQNAIRAITESRTAFIDLDDAAPVAAPTITGRALDLETQPTPTVQAAPVPTPQLDLI
jgi:hypothetical protein